MKKLVMTIYVLFGLLLLIPANMIVNYYGTLASIYFIQLPLIVAMFSISLFIGLYLGGYRLLSLYGSPGKWRIQRIKLLFGVALLIGSVLLWFVAFGVPRLPVNYSTFQIYTYDRFHIWTILSGFILMSALKKDLPKEDPQPIQE